MSKVGQLYPEIREWYLIPLISLKTKILENFEFVFLKEDIHIFISSTEIFLSDIRCLRCTGLKKVNFFVGHLVVVSCDITVNLCKPYISNFCMLLILQALRFRIYVRYLYLFFHSPNLFSVRLISCCQTIGWESEKIRKLRNGTQHFVSK